MAPHLNHNRSIKGTIISVIAIMIGIVACTAGTVIAIDMRCRADINHWMPVYPNAEIQVVQQTGFFRPRASGITEIIYITEDDAATVRSWYRDYRRSITMNVSNESNPDTAARGMASTSYRVVENSDGTGSQIFQLSECAYN